MATYYVRTDGSDTNAGTGPATNQAWQTITKAVGATGVGVGDTVYIAPGIYRGNFTAGFTNPANEGQRITIAGNPTASLFTGVNAGPVILTNYLTDNVSFTLGDIFSISKNFVTVQDMIFYGWIPTPSPFYRPFVAPAASALKLYRCLFGVPSSNAQKAPVLVTINAGSTGLVMDKCVVLNGGFALGASSHSGAWDSQTVITDNIFINNNTHANNSECLSFFAGTSGQFGGIKVVNNYMQGVYGVRMYNALSTSFPSVIQNCYIEASTTAIQSDVGNTSAVLQTYNILNAPNSVTGVNSSVTSKTNAFNPINASMSKIQGWADYPFISALSSLNAGVSAGINTNSPATDIYGTTWLLPATPSINAAEFQSYTPSSQYLPTERNASTITIAPGSTSQSIELYLGATGLTASTAGLSARYNRTRTASVSIPLVARTIAQAWTSGGFAEVDATNMPGVYRLDLPDAALAAGADDVTIVVRGASGTNGAVMTVKLSSGGLTSAQTASAVWGASPAGYVDATTYGGVVNQIDQTVTGTSTLVQDVPYHVWEELTANHDTHGSFGWNVLRADAPSKEGLVTLHQSGGISRIDADVHAIVNDTAAAAELKGALLHTGGDYITADLLNPVASAQTLRIGPFGVRADGGGADGALDLNQSTAANIVVQMTDGQGTGIDQTSATVQAKVYNVAGALVATYTCTAAYALGGFMSIPMTTTVTGTAGSYLINLWSTVGATVTVSGPLQLRVRAI